MENNVHTYWDMKPNNLINVTKKFINVSLNKNKNIVNVNDHKILLEILSDDITELLAIENLCNFLFNLSPDINMKNAAKESIDLLNIYLNELVKYNDIIYDKILKFKANYTDSEDISFIKYLLKKFNISGKGMNNNLKNNYISIKSGIDNLENNIKNKINLCKKYIYLSNIELYGVPESLKLQYTLNDDNKFKIELDVRNFNILMQYLVNDNVRQKVENEYSNKFINCIDDISKLLVLKNKQSNMLNFKNYIEMIGTTKNIISSCDEIQNFLSNITDLLKEKYNMETNILLKFKNNDKNLENNSNELNSWDIQYYLRKWKNKFGFKDKFISQYFVLENTISKIFVIFEDIFDIKIKKIVSNIIKWHDDVELYGIYHNNNIVAFFYLDMYKRTNKLSNIGYYFLQNNCIYPIKTNSMNIPISIMVKNYWKKNITLLSYSEVVKFAQDFVDILYNSLNYAKFSILCGSNKRGMQINILYDLIEYIFTKENIITKLSEHYKTKEKLPRQTVNKIIKTNNMGFSINLMKQILISTYDVYIHSDKELISFCENNIDHDKCFNMYNNLYIALHNSTLENINPNNILLPGSFPDYLFTSDGQYYSKILSKMYAGNLYHYYKNNFNSYTKKLGQDIKDFFYTNDFSRLLEIIGNNDKGFILLHDIKNYDDIHVNTTSLIENITDCDSDISNNFSEDGEDLSHDIMSLGYNL